MKVSIILIRLSLTSMFEDTVYSLTVSRDDKYIISSSDNSIKMWSFWRKKQVHEFKDPSAGSASVYSVVVSRNNKYIIAGFEEGVLRVFDLKKRIEVFSGNYQTEKGCKFIHVSVY